MSDPYRPAPEADAAPERAGSSTVGIYEAPERRAGRLPVLLIVLVVVIVLAAAVFWLM